VKRKSQVQNHGGRDENLKLEKRVWGTSYLITHLSWMRPWSEGKGGLLWKDSKPWVIQKKIELKKNAREEILHLSRSSFGWVCRIGKKHGRHNR